MSAWIKLGTKLYNLDNANHIDIESDGVRGAEVVIYFGGAMHSIFTEAEADAVRRYVAELVAQRKVTDITVRPPAVSNLDSPGGGP